jgi:hypothetical protein
MLINTTLKGNSPFLLRENSPYCKRGIPDYQNASGNRRLPKKKKWLLKKDMDKIGCIR